MRLPRVRRGLKCEQKEKKYIGPLLSPEEFVLSIQKNVGAVSRVPMCDTLETR